MDDPWELWEMFHNITLYMLHLSVLILLKTADVSSLISVGANRGMLYGENGAMLLMGT